MSMINRSYIVFSIQMEIMSNSIQPMIYATFMFVMFYIWFPMEKAIFTNADRREPAGGPEQAIKCSTYFRIKLNIF